MLIERLLKIILDKMWNYVQQSNSKNTSENYIICDAIWLENANTFPTPSSIYRKMFNDKATLKTKVFWPSLSPRRLTPSGALAAMFQANERRLFAPGQFWRQPSLYKPITACCSFLPNVYLKPISCSCIHVVCVSSFSPFNARETEPQRASCANTLLV